MSGHVSVSNYGRSVDCTKLLETTWKSIVGVERDVLNFRGPMRGLEEVFGDYI